MILCFSGCASHSLLIELNFINFSFENYARTYTYNLLRKWPISRAELWYCTETDWPDPSVRPKSTSTLSLPGPTVVSWLFPIPLLQTAEYEDTRIIREFAELVDANEAFENLDAKSEDKTQKPNTFPSIGERFMGMKAAIVTDNLGLKSFGGALGFKVLRWNELCHKTHSLSESPLLVSGLLKLLGFQDGKMQENFLFDAVFVHVEANKNANDLKDVEFLDRLVGDLLNVARPETDIGSRLHISVVLSYGATSTDNDPELLLVDAKSKNNAETVPFYPRQSYMMKAGQSRENIRQHCPMLLGQYQNAVTRVDTVKSFSFIDFAENGGNLVIPADRFIHEVAFKLWKAPKYGA